MTKIIRAAISTAKRLVELAGGLGVESETLRPDNSRSVGRG
jgi:hypothetical protein